MNAGYMSYVGMTSFIILWSSGWQLQLLGDVRRWIVFIFVGLWLILMPFSWEMNAHYTIDLSVSLIIGLLIIVIRSIQDRALILQFMLLFIFLSIWHAWMVYAQQLNYMYLISPALAAAISEALLAAVLLKNPVQQITILSNGVMSGLVLVQLWNKAEHIHIGHVSGWDHLFVTILLTRAISVVAQWSRNKLYSR